MTTYNALNTSTIASFVSKQVDAKLKQAIKVSMIPENEKIALFHNTPGSGTTTTLNGSSAKAGNIFDQQIVPTLDTTSQIWDTIVDGSLYANPDYGVLIFRGNGNYTVDIDTLVCCDTAATNKRVETQLYLNDRAVNANYTGGRGYNPQTYIVITGDGKDATASVTILNGYITAITPINRGTGYTAATVTIIGSGIEAAATASINGVGGIDTITLSNAQPCLSGIPGFFETIQGKMHEVRRSYNLELVPNDRLDLRVVVDASGTTASCKIYQAKIEVQRPIINYHVP